jgi:hypothetical protein
MVSFVTLDVKKTLWVSQRGANAALIPQAYSLYMVSREALGKALYC